eukprot:Gregarina_sp_Poly_1__9342@NODE_580_length_7449_cov_96_149688_g63_i1_p2_GENE_NODE_580_length_7449_cov_96_149688_g63_i1NODE_580_length_7449_cov_96_149688_g63_i1_p2_ORF_typecomplete_len363_score54_35Miff/PF05644_11/0_33_NODE_580_length_7449_cov_96_149688_g63_i13391427
MQQQYGYQKYNGQVVTEENLRTSQSSDYIPNTATAVFGGVCNQRQQSYQAFTGPAQAVGFHEESYGEFHEGQILGEQVVEHKQVVPTKRTWTETVMTEKVIQVPETIVREAVEEETKIVREKIVQVAKPKYVTVVKDKIIPVEEQVIHHVPEDVYVENIIFKDKHVDVMQPKYVKTKVEVEVPEYYDEVITQEVPVPRYVDDVQTVVRTVYHEVHQPPQIKEIEVPEYKKVEVLETVVRNVPIGVQHIVHEKYDLPQIEHEYEEVQYPVFVARFQEVMVPAEYMTEESILESENLRRQIQTLTTTPMPSLCVLEDMMERVRRFKPEHVTDPGTIRDRMARKIHDYKSQHGDPTTAPPQFEEH